MLSVTPRAPRPIVARTASLFALPLALAACIGDPVSPKPEEPSLSLSAAAPRRVVSDPRLLTCPAGHAQVARAVIGPEGGTIAVGGTSVVFPAGAVSEPTAFTLKVPRSRFVEVEIWARGIRRFELLKPVTVTIDYSRCTTTPGREPTVWFIDPRTRELIEMMDAVVDPVNETITFTTTHLSGYAIAV